ncbi:plasmid stabilization system antitoxin protein [Treponema primitia ZAS-2]|uniref:Plasmid stabilization system antitoxin protein n=2 Tax=Treponema primitia TaxID=88058 RepID=F5YMX6_TREPZ|nr:plasmid stabilization system antitoxin protein [Treponema primitia ZAS-2]
MPKIDTIHMRIEPELKAGADAVLSRLGLSTAEAITVFLNQVLLTGGLPFEVKLPAQDAMSGEHRRYILEKLKEAEDYAARPDAKWYNWAEFRENIREKHGL